MSAKTTRTTKATKAANADTTETVHIEGGLTLYEMRVRLDFTDDLLGTASANPDIHAEFIASKAPDPETIEAEVAAIGVDKAVEKSKTIFPKNAKGEPIIWDYQIRGFFKEACGALRNAEGTLSSDVKAHKKKVDNTIFVKEREIPLHLPKNTDLTDCQRPLRAQTPQGERNSLANSEVASEGTWVEFTVQCLNKKDLNLVKEWLSYGALKGLGQWRNSGKGRFKVTYIS